MIRAYFIAALLMGFTLPALAHAEVFTVAPPEIRAEMSAFFSRLEAGNSSEAVHGLLFGRLYQDKKQAVEGVADTFATMAKNYGKVVGWELVAEIRKSPFYYNQIYMMRMEEAPIFIHVSVYKNGAGGPWEVVKITFSDSDDDLTLK
jgi:hypothetical protein